ncbi:MAG: ThuA domain-containing protein [Phycisphaerae bacterium]
MSKIRVTVWNEFRHEQKDEKPKEVYPNGIHAVIASFLNDAEGISAGTATLDEPEHGLTEEILAKTDVLLWWGHMAHGEVSDEIVDRVQKRILQGMGLMVLHSGHFSKIFKRMMGTTCQLKWREVAEREVLWVTRPGHPILEGIDDHVILPHTEMYGEHFDVPEPEETILISGFEGGEVFRSGLTYRRGAGKIFYFRPGHETYPIYYNKTIQKIMINGVRWLKSSGSMEIKAPNRKMGWFLENE